MTKNSTNSLLRYEIKKAIALLIVVFFVSIMIITYIQISNVVKDFTGDLKKDQIYLNSDLNKIHLSYARQLRYVKSQLHINQISKQDIKSFFDINPLLLLDRSVINTVLILDDKRQIVYSDLISDQLTSKLSSLNDRKYLDKIEKNPNEVIFGEIVQGVISKVLSMPIGIALENKDKQYIGSIIFSVNLRMLSNNLSDVIYKYIKIQDYVQNEKNIISNRSNDLFSSIFNKIILGDNKIKVSIYNDLIKKYSIIEYDLKVYRDKAITNITMYSFLISLILIGLFSFYYFNILQPLKPSLAIVNSYALLSPNTNRNLIRSVVTSIANQSTLLEQKEYEYKNQIVQIMSIICSASYLTHYVRNKLEYLAEEIEDVTARNKQSKKNVEISKKNKDFEIEEIKEILFENEREISAVLDSFNKLLRLLEFQKKENVQIVDLLYSSNIRKSIVNNHVQSENNNIDKIVDYSVSVYKSVFYWMIQEILRFNTGPVRLIEVNILEYKRIEFIFVETGLRKMLSQHEILTLSRLWAIFNNIQVTIEYYDKKMKIFCQFN